MKLLFLVSVAVVFVSGGIISHDDHGRATSYQNIHMEHFHPVPTYIRKEHKHLLEHPIPIGKSSSKVEIHHGDKHDHGYAITDSENTIHGHGFQGFDAADEHEGVAEDYQVHDQGEDYAQLQGQIGEDGTGLGHYGLSSGVEGYQAEDES